MTGRLYVIGVGPGDPELLTLKAVRILKTVNCICVPKGREEGSSLALSIVKKVLNLDGKEIIEAYFPMRKTKRQGQRIRVSEYQGKTDASRPLDCELDSMWRQTVEMVLSRLNKGVDTAFITIGDPAVYSTFFYLFDSLLELNPTLNIEIIPGVSSINASAAAAKISLGLADDKIAILPANYINDLAKTLRDFDSVVLMKVHKVFNEIRKTLNEMNLLDNAVYITQAGMKDEKIFKNIRDVKEKDLNYFSMVIVKK